IRRTFRGDRIYSATMGAYVKRLLQDGFSQECFIEGGRSRTGKLLSPKFGMLTLEVDAWLTGVKPDAYFAPVSLSYERIVEARSYQHELLGGEKQKEDAKALLSATKVLRRRYGRITIRPGEPISLAQLFRERGVDPKTVTADEKKKLVQHLGLRIAAGINAAAPLAPTGLAAAVLLSHDRRALSETEILDRAEFLNTAALDGGAHGGAGPIRPLVANAVESLSADGTLKRHEAGGERFYAVPEERRIALDYHKNGILHFLVAPAILSAATDGLSWLLTGPMGAREWMRQTLDRGRAAYLAGRILRLEALTRPTLENAVQVLRDRGVVVGAKLQLTPEWASREKLAALAEEADLFLR